jgi:2-hydroxychromene-2-carboxylate isomerase
MTSPYSDPKKLYFLFDFISHNAYLAWAKVAPIADKHGLAIEPVPVLFAGFLERFGQRGPAEMPSKARWMLWNVLRKAKLHGIPIAPPSSHPFNPLIPLRACAAVQGADRVKLVDRLFSATWVESKAVTTEEVVRAEVAACGFDANAVMSAIGTDAVKSQLKTNLENALAAGAFGVPTMIAKGQLFWGFDDLEYLDAFLSGKDALPADRSEYAKWFAIKPSAMRKSVSKPS